MGPGVLCIYNSVDVRGEVKRCSISFSGFLVYFLSSLESLFVWNGVRVPLAAIDEEFGMFSIFKTLFSVGSNTGIYISVHLNESLTKSRDYIGNLCCSIMYDQNSSNIPLCFYGVLQTRINI